MVFLEKEEAKAIEEASKAVVKTLDTTEKLGSFLSDVFGTVVKDATGILGGDYLHHLRLRNAAGLFQRTQEILQERGIEQPHPMSPSVALPLLNAAQDETREELTEIWARLLANGMDPERTKEVRASIVNVVKMFDPLEAAILETSTKHFAPNTLNMPTSGYASPEGIRNELGIEWDELLVSVNNLKALDCIEENPQKTGRTYKGDPIRYFKLTPLGREILKVCSL